MSFCPKCGRQRTTNTRFCGGCGNDFGPQAASGGTPAVAEPEEPAAFAAAEQTRLDVPVEQTRLDRPFGAAPPDRYASWYAEPSLADEPAPAGGAAASGAAADSVAAGGAAADSVAAGSVAAGGAAADQWNAADTVYAEPTRTAGYTPYAPPAGPAYPPAYPPSAPVTPGGGAGGRRTAILVVLVVLVVLGAGGGAYALTRSHGSSTAQPPSNPTVTAPPASTAPTVQAPTSPVVNASASPTASPSVTVTPTRPAGVQVAPGVASDPAEPQVLAYLNRYFSAINRHNYNAYQSLLDAQEQQGNSQSTFDSGYATTKDSGESLTGIEDTGGGTLTANVSFTSHQNTADSVDGSACNKWQISLYLVPQGSSYVMTAAPAGYHAAYSDC
jgi:hypothetical protein